MTGHGPVPGPRKMGDLLGSILGRHGYGNITTRQELESAWSLSASEEVRRHATLGSFRRGIVEVLVDSAVLLQQLEGFEKQSLLSKLQSHMRQEQIKGLKFKRL